MAFDSHIVTVRRLKKYIDDVIGKKANLPNNKKTIIDNLGTTNTNVTNLTTQTNNLSTKLSSVSNKVNNLSNARIRKTQTLKTNQYGTAQIPTITGYIPYSIVPTGYESHGIFFYNGVYVTRFVNTSTGDVFKPVSNVSVKCEVFYEKI